MLIQGTDGWFYKKPKIAVFDACYEDFVVRGMTTLREALDVLKINAVGIGSRQKSDMLVNGKLAPCYAWDVSLRGPLPPTTEYEAKVNFICPGDTEYVWWFDVTYQAWINQVLSQDNPFFFKINVSRPTDLIRKSEVRGDRVRVYLKGRPK